MINEKQFAKYYISFWTNLLARQKKALVMINDSLSHNFNDLHDSQTSSNRRALINQSGFNLFKFSNKKQVNITKFIKDANNTQEVFDLTQAQLFAYLSKEDEDLKPLDDIEKNEAIYLGKNIEKYFYTKYKYSELLINPEIQGCGLINNCFADVIVGDTIYEIKASDLKIQQMDIRQLLTYCALNHSSGQYNIKNIGYYNPRTGQYFKMNIDEFCYFYSKKNSVELLNEIVYFLSDTQKST